MKKRGVEQQDASDREVWRGGLEKESSGRTGQLPLAGKFVRTINCR